jgi:hypothetical protein
METLRISLFLYYQYDATLVYRAKLRLGKPAIDTSRRLRSGKAAGAGG